MTTFNTWKRFFQDQDGAAGNKAFDGLLNLVREGTDAEKAGKLRTEADTVWLARHPEGSVVFVHHLTVMGGSRTQPDLSIFALVGDGASACPIKLTVADATKYEDIATPSWTNRVDKQGAAALEAATVGNVKPIPALLPLPPAIATAFLRDYLLGLLAGAEVAASCQVL